MPRSVNVVASRTRRKKIMKQTKGYFGARKNVWTVSKNAYEKGLTYAYRDRKAKKEHLEDYGFNVSTLEFVNMECLTLNLWVKFMRKTSV